MSTMQDFSPGELVRARGREWIVLGTDNGLRLRPLTGSEEDVETLQPKLEIEEVSAARFPAPDDTRIGAREAAQLLRDALRLSMRRGAGPFRSAGRLAFEPCAYQLAPLILALRQEPTRLLIADDVGVGKTIEAGLIVREFLDRGDADRFTVICPPHLVEQWVDELASKFAISAMPVTAAQAARLERDLPDTVSVFDAYPHTVVSLDFIKSDRRRDDFLRACPEMVVVDEAHACVAGGGRARHQRHGLLKRLAEKRDKARHMILLTATPHSGDETAFHNLLGLIDPAFARINEVPDEERRRLRERLANHFIQRRRADITSWREPGLFPSRETAEFTYRLTGAHEQLFNEVLDYCADIVEAADGAQRQRLAFWGTLALMRCVGSSPAAAAQALRTRAAVDVDEAEEAAIVAQALDDEEVREDDVEPGAAVEDPRLAGLIRQADALAAEPKRDPKFKALKAALKGLIAEGFRPIVFCRYIATAKSVGNALAGAFKDHEVAVVTGELPAEEREQRVEALGAHEKRILVATDCLSEGINLQAYFDAALHYDLSWNPTRHQQREGRIDRFGQKSGVVRTALLYGENNPVDGAVLKVILRKAERIERETGVRVPMPDRDGSLTQALMHAVMLRARERRQFSLDLLPETEAFEVAWSNASEQERRSRTIFAQNALRPEEVLPEWDETRLALGGFEDTERFVTRALTRLGREPTRRPDGIWKASLAVDSPMLRERLESEGLLAGDDAPRSVRLAFSPRAPAGAMSVHRTHPLPSVLAEAFLEEALEADPETDDPAVLPRVGAWETSAVKRLTTLYVLRVRHRIDSRGRLGPRFAMAEEAQALALANRDGSRQAAGLDAFALLDADSGDVPQDLRKREIASALAALEGRMAEIDAFARERAEQLAADHTRVRRVLGSRANVSVSAVTPVDVIGLYVLFPKL